jgi:hypothetical protein
MNGNEPPPLPSRLPPPLPPGRAPSPPPPLPIKTPPVSAAQPAPVVPVPPTAGQSAPQATPGGRQWWVWCFAGAFCCFVLFIVCLNCNPATTATDRIIGKLQGAIAQELDPKLHPLLSWGVSLLFENYLALPYAQMRAAGFTIALVSCLLIPLGGTLFSAALGHPLFMLGGAPGGWRSTWQSFGLHRLACDLATLAVLALVLVAPMEPLTAAGILCAFLPMIRFASQVLLWVSLGRAHGFGPVRIIFLGLPSIFITTLFSGFLAFMLALYFYAYLIARSF